MAGSGVVLDAAEQDTGTFYVQNQSKAVDFQHGGPRGERILPQRNACSRKEGGLGQMGKLGRCSSGEEKDEGGDDADDLGAARLLGADAGGAFAQGELMQMAQQMEQEAVCGRAALAALALEVQHIE